MRRNHVLRRLAAGEASVGTWLTLPSPECAEQLGRAGLDWLVIDAEHYPIDVRTLGQMLLALSATPVAPLVRVAANRPELFKRALDAGAWGIVVPMVNSAAEAEQAVAAIRYPPRGARSVGGGRYALSFDTTAATYYRHADDQIALVVQIEHRAAVERIDEIVRVPGIDACFVGPNDLAASLGLGVGLPLESADPPLVEAIAQVAAACRRHGVAAGIHCSDAAAVNQRIAQGFQLCTMGTEMTFLLRGLGAAVAALDWTAAAPERIDPPPV